ncbi:MULTISPECIES: hypothetical protein [Bradyrhizobium]|uniref:Uncharacterized protein n=1 Tax=Bradyrhizobium elkanii TaxID=29448 RepID=A0A8I1Y6P0_BRAEL|nr:MULTISPECIES: hypothetical protein [Bradyrhizobium]MBP1293250.1 hypothetical protein [Bradyrhizobium elkanii]MCP1926167.1 hypothetical protein [Bradyrhizobium elkanii]MCS3476340.1 hypothetical protein [Bradyrhizobium elkanii]MCS3583075.1 hypothetical protein [Bradyrhizobium elkanii]MCS3716643.1 hypothetical protein [Bradyrhizobium elkanii]
MKGDIVNSDGVLVAVVIDSAIFDLKGRKLCDLKGSRIYRLSGELVGHLNESGGSLRRLDKATDSLFQQLQHGRTIARNRNDTETFDEGGARS